MEAWRDCNSSRNKCNNLVRYTIHVRFAHRARGPRAQDRNQIQEVRPIRKSLQSYFRHHCNFSFVYVFEAEAPYRILQVSDVPLNLTVPHESVSSSGSIATATGIAITDSKLLVSYHFNENSSSVKLLFLKPVLSALVDVPEQKEDQETIQDLPATTRAQLSPIFPMHFDKDKLMALSKFALNQDARLAGKFDTRSVIN